MRNIIFASGEYYHVYSRGVDKRDIFLDDTDRKRFLRTMQIANIKDGEELVAILCYVFMGNHYHFLLQEKAERGVSRYMQRLGNSYTKYFNVRWNRTGRLFSSPFQARHVENTKYLQHLTRYIHLNPVPLLRKKNYKIELERYPWSSYRHYLGLEYRPFVHSLLVMNDFSDTDEYRAFMYMNTPLNILDDRFLFSERD